MLYLNKYGGQIPPYFENKFKFNIVKGLGLILCVYTQNLYLIGDICQQEKTITDHQNYTTSD